jgi:DNA-binding NtrC family response regulator
MVAYSESGSVVAPDSLSQEIITAGREMQMTTKAASKTSQLDAEDYAESTIQEATDELERRMIQEALRRSEGNIAQAAKKLGLSRMGLYLKMNRLNLQR